MGDLQLAAKSSVNDVGIKNMPKTMIPNKASAKGGVVMFDTIFVMSKTPTKFVFFMM